MRARFWFWLYKHTGPPIDEWSWRRYLGYMWLRPAPHVAPRGRTIDRPTDETGVE